MKKIGLDLGSSSIGWAIREHDEIIKHGVITFKSGMIKGQGGYSSPTKDRRNARSKRRLIQARKYRKWELLKVLIRNQMTPLENNELEKWSKYKKGEKREFPENKQFLQWLACDFTYILNGINYKNPYELRIKSIDKRVTPHEFGRALYHLVQRRGYKNIGENENEEFDIELAKKESETKTQIERREKEGFVTALSNNRTIAEALHNEFLEKGKRARNQYPLRREYKTELEKICEAQRYDISKSTQGDYENEFVQSVYKAIIWQRPLRSQKGNIGKCTLEPTKARCPVSHPIFEIFRAWSFINTIKTIEEDNKKEFLPQEYRVNLFNNLFLTKDKNFKFEEMKSFLNKQFGQNKRYNYPINSKTGKYDTSVSGMPVCKWLVKIFGEETKSGIEELHKYNITNAPKTKNGYSIYDLWHILFDFDEGHIPKFAKEKLCIEDEPRKVKGKDMFESPLLSLKRKMPTGYADLSLKAMRRIIPFLKEGFLYNDAVILAKIPDYLNNDWESNKTLIYSLLKKSNEEYNWNKTITTIANNLIDTHKGLPSHEKFAHKTFDYKLDISDFTDIKQACESHYGEKTWAYIEDKQKIIDEVANLYQEYFTDNKRSYRKVPLATNIFKNLLIENNIIVADELYHHSNRDNIYGESEKYVNKDTGAITELLPIPLIDSIKNPMFNKALSVLRRLVNTLIINGEIDEDTEVIVEVASDELNDNNKRAAIERYQRERESKRGKYREFLQQYKDEEKTSLNVEENIPKFELWTEQIFEAKDIEAEKYKSINDIILGQKDAIKRYELWIEQKGQCMYTGRIISISQLFSNEIEIEHTIPRSILPDNTMANQTVCFSMYNSDIKNNRIPTHCPNYENNIEGIGTSIKHRLDKWETVRDNYKDLYESKLNPSGNEDETIKNKRIQSKHYFKMHYDYWRDKIERFTAEEVKDSWARRQLVDTQMVSKYAREFLKTYFKKVFVQKGSVTANFRKIYSFQDEQEIKSRNKHTHHAIDAAVLTLIPTSSSYRDRLLKQMYEMAEKKQGQFTCKPLDYTDFSSQKIINQIENNTLIVNYQKDKIIQQTYRNVRKRGRLQYLKRDGKFVLNENGDKIKLKSAGDSIRESLYKESFIGKIRNVERDEKTGKPKRNKNGSWQFKTGKDEFGWVRRKKIEEAKVEDIVDPDIRNIVKVQGTNSIDPQGNKIRHIRVKVKKGKEVKERENFRSKHEYKNMYYSESDSIPYAVMLDSKIERKMIPVSSYEVAMVYKEYKEFNASSYIQMFHPELSGFNESKLLYVGQKVLVLKSDEEYENRKDIDFQINRMYRITQFDEGTNSIYLKFHLEALDDTAIGDKIKNIKDKILLKIEQDHNLPIIVENEQEINTKKRKKDYEDKRFKFSSPEKDFRLKRLAGIIGIEDVKKLKRKHLDKFRKYHSTIEIEGETPLLKVSTKNCNFLYEGYDFEISILGEIKWLDIDL